MFMFSYFPEIKFLSVICVHFPPLTFSRSNFTMLHKFPCSRVCICESLFALNALAFSGFSTQIELLCSSFKITVNFVWVHKSVSTRALFFYFFLFCFGVVLCYSRHINEIPDQFVARIIKKKQPFFFFRKALTARIVKATITLFNCIRSDVFIFSSRLNIFFFFFSLFHRVVLSKPKIKLLTFFFFSLALIVFVPIFFLFI